MKSNQKYQIGNSVVITRGQYKGKHGKIVDIADFRLYNRLTYRVKGDNFESAFVSYELAPAPEKIEDAVKPEKIAKIVVEFDIDEKHPLQLNNNVYERASKVKINDKVVRNRYGANDYIEKTLTLTLTEARKMYLAGGDLKKLALRVYAEEELKVPPRTWKEYCKKAYGKFYYINYGKIQEYTLATDSIGGLNEVAAGEMLPSKEMADAVLAFEKLLILRDSWIGNWKPNWEKSVPCITCMNNDEIYIGEYSYTSHPLSFPTVEMAEDFNKCFKEFILIAKTII